MRGSPIRFCVRSPRRDGGSVWPLAKSRSQGDSADTYPRGDTLALGGDTRPALLGNFQECLTVFWLIPRFPEPGIEPRTFLQLVWPPYHCTRTAPAPRHYHLLFRHLYLSSEKLILLVLHLRMSPQETSATLLPRCPSGPESGLQVFVQQSPGRLTSSLSTCIISNRSSSEFIQ